MPNLDARWDIDVPAPETERGRHVEDSDPFAIRRWRQHSDDAAQIPDWLEDLWPNADTAAAGS